MTYGPHGRAAVVGGGFAGLVAARVLADHFEHVTVFERDRITPRAVPRSGTPQSHHPHTLLARGAQILEGLFPGLRDELITRGAPLTDFGLFSILFPTGWSPPVRSGLAMQTFSHPLLESTIRRRVLALPNLTLNDATQVHGLRSHDGRITGVRFSDRAADRPDRTQEGQEVQEVYDADLVVIADGRHSRLPAWLRSETLATPKTLTVDGRLSYTSRLYRRDPSAPLDWHASLQTTLAPRASRGGGVMAIEDGRWLVCLFGAGGDTASTDPDAFNAYAASLANPHIRDVVATCEPAGDIHRYLGLGGRWHRYDRLQPRPGGLVVLGDALCGLNPIYGQGMTVACQQALALSQEISRWPLDTACRRYQRRARRTLLLPWFMSTSLDYGWHPGSAPLAAAAAARFLHRLLRRIPDDPDLYRRFLHVQHLMASPLLLLRPSSSTLVRRTQGG